MFAPGAVAIQKLNFPLFFGHKRDAGMGLYRSTVTVRPNSGSESQPVHVLD